MDLETYLRTHLDTKNHAGRALAEHRLRVEQLDNGVIAIYVHPDGFNAEAVVFGIVGNTLVQESGLRDQVLEREAVRIAEVERRDDEHAAEVQRQRDDQARLQMEEADRLAKEAAAARPGDITKTLPAGDPAPQPEAAP